MPSPRHLLFGALALCATACHPAPFDVTYQGPRPPADVRVTPTPAFETLVLEPFARLETLTDQPAPSFDASGRRLIYQTIHEEEGGRRGLNMFNVELKQEQPFYTHTDYIMGGQVYQPVNTFSPVFLDADSVLSSTSDINYEPQAFRISMTGESRVFSVYGNTPRVSPSGRTVLVQSPEGVYELDVYGEKLRKHPGFDPVWSPQDDGFLVRMTPFEIYIYEEILDAHPWPEGVVPPEVDSGGLLWIPREGQPTILDVEGSGAVFHPSGRSVLYEVIPSSMWVTDMIGAESFPALRRYDFDTQTTTDLEVRGRDVAYHPSGAFFACISYGGILLSDGTSTRALEISGDFVQFSPDGRFLVALEAREHREMGAVRDVVLYRITE